MRKRTKKALPTEVVEVDYATEQAGIKQHIRETTNVAVRLMMMEDAALAEDQAYVAVYTRITENTNTAESLKEFDVSSLDAFLKLVRG